MREVQRATVLWPELEDEEQTCKPPGWGGGGVGGCVAGWGGGTAKHPGRTAVAKVHGFKTYAQNAAAMNCACLSHAAAAAANKQTKPHTTQCARRAGTFENVRIDACIVLCLDLVCFCGSGLGI